MQGARTNQDYCDGVGACHRQRLQAGDDGLR